MKVVCAMVARYADLSENGALHIFGGDIDTLNIQGEFPATIPLPIYYVAKVALDPDEAGKRYETRIDLMDPEGAVVETSPQTITSAPQAETGQASKISMMVVLGGVTFPRVGPYFFRVVIDGNEVVRTPLFLQQVPNTPATEGKA